MNTGIEGLWVEEVSSGFEIRIGEARAAFVHELTGGGLHVGVQPLYYNNKTVCDMFIGVLAGLA
jgi:hypothetical protein